MLASSFGAEGIHVAVDGDEARDRARIGEEDHVRARRSADAAGEVRAVGEGEGADPGRALHFDPCGAREGMDLRELEGGGSVGAERELVEHGLLTATEQAECGQVDVEHAHVGDAGQLVCRGVVRGTNKRAAIASAHQPLARRAARTHPGLRDIVT